jgi:hypothetical protein
MVICMISPLATLTLAFMAFTASAQDQNTGNNFTLYFGKKCEAGNEAATYSLSTVIAQPRGCQNVISESTGFESYGITTSGNDPEYLNNITCYLEEDKFDCPDPVTDQNRISRGSDARPGEPACRSVKPSPLSDTFFFQGSFSCFLTT